ncbi:MAG: metalloregulator ArsR/SmtB family transcription factor [Frankiaceae bacterium]|jgi:DNA-binding transcriptional ArsR family regulator/uncharacterized protein YndB with AHSA1/START domain|nr:metalloregulator ArsR/SmtB family transcription factor [Frankiaceae bacterium]
MTVERDRAIEAFAEPRRRAILELVSSAELPAGKVSAAFPEVSQSAVSQHLRTLREAGLVRERRDGTRRWYRASAGALEELRQYLGGLVTSSLAVAESPPADEGGGDPDPVGAAATDGWGPLPANPPAAAGLSQRPPEAAPAPVREGRNGLRRPQQPTPAPATAPGSVPAEPVATSRMDDALLAMIAVPCSAPEAFALFLDTLAAWWPLRDFSMAPGEVAAVEVDRRCGGSITEVRRDGSRARWGTLLAWEPGHSFAMNWLVAAGLEQTVVTVTFTALARQQARVQIVHSGWRGVDAARRGLQLGYVEGWARVLAAFAASLRADQ